MSVANITIVGVVWNFMELLLRRGISAATALLLAYFLSPADFGIISMSALFLAVATGLMDSGLREALIRRRHLSERLLTGAMWASLCLGCVAYLLLYVLAPWIARFYIEPRLVLLVRVGGLAILFNALQMAPIARLQQALDFKSLIRASFPAALVSSVFAFGLAWGGFGVWALVAQNVVASAVTAALLWRFSGWRPMGRVNFQLLPYLYRFGYKIFVSGLLALLVRNIVPGMLGKFLGAAAAGYYYFVDRIMEMVMGQLVYSIQNVTYPAFSRISNQDESLREAYRKVVRVMVFLIAPLLMIAAGLAEPLFETFFSRDWWPAINCFRGLCVVYMLYPVHALNLNVLKVKGRSDLFLKIEIIKTIVVLLVFFCALPFGLNGVLVGQVFSTAFCYIPNALYSRPLINYSVGEQLLDIFPYFACSVLAGCAAAYSAAVLPGQPAWLVLSVGVSCSSGVYLLLCRLLNLQAASFIFLAVRNLRSSRT